MLHDPLLGSGKVMIGGVREPFAAEAEFIAKHLGG
jgi:hypothetical protein